MRSYLGAIFLLSSLVFMFSIISGSHTLSFFFGLIISIPMMDAVINSRKITLNEYKSTNKIKKYVLYSLYFAILFILSISLAGMIGVFSNNKFWSLVAFPVAYSCCFYCVGKWIHNTATGGNNITLNIYKIFNLYIITQLYSIVNFIIVTIKTDDILLPLLSAILMSFLTVLLFFLQAVLLRADVKTDKVIS